MDLKRYEEICKEMKYNMLFLEIYYNLRCNENLMLLEHNLESENIKKQIEKLIYFIHEAYLDDETRMDLGFMCDMAVEFKNEILNDKISTWDFLRECGMKA